MRKVLLAMVAIFGVLSLIMTVSAHSGRTDSNGGHKDNNNVSGLGGYHYHCGGYPAHLHTKGYCPYTDIFPSSVKVGAESNEAESDDGSAFLGFVVVAVIGGIVVYKKRKR